MNVTAFHSGQHVDADGLHPAIAECPFCGSTDRTPLFDVQTDPVVTLLECHGCGAATVSQMPTQATLDEYYSHYYDENSVGVAAENPERFARRIAGYAFSLPRPVTSHFRILDFGGGNGALSQSVGQTAPADVVTVDVVVVDYDPDHVLPSTDRVTMSSVKEVTDVDEQPGFELVMASAVLEHLPEPMPVLDALVARVAPGGVLYFRTPYVAPFMQAASKLKVDVDFTFPAHLHDMGQPFWDTITTRLAHGADLEIIKSRPAPVETGIRHLGRTIGAGALKAPWRVLGERWPYVGGWEIALRNNAR